MYVKSNKKMNIILQNQYDMIFQVFYLVKLSKEVTLCVVKKRKDLIIIWLYILKNEKKSFCFI
jgi:hypothetical protein